jgi:hypothetical protein
MKRTGFDERRDQQVADDFTREMRPCSFCGASTERETLAEYGARCGPCFTQYVTGGKPNPQMPTRQHKVATLNRLKALLVVGSGNHRQWAVNLRNREHSGEELSLAQRQGWRAALKDEEVVE